MREYHCVWTREKVIRAIHAFVKKMRRIPTVPDFERRKTAETAFLPSHPIVQKFGGMALVYDLYPEHKEYRYWSKAEAAAALRTWMREQQKVPTQKELRGIEGLPSVTTIYRFGGMEFVYAIGHELGLKRPTYTIWTHEKVVAAIKNFREKHGRLPKYEDFKHGRLPKYEDFKHGGLRLPSVHTLDKFGGVYAVYRLCGLANEAAEASACPPATTARTCLRCAEDFMSTGRHHRLCDKCRRANRIREASPV